MSKFKEKKFGSKNFRDLLPRAKKNFINGVFLIDGNHTFLHCLEKNQKRISELKEKVEKNSKKERNQELKNNILKRNLKIEDKEYMINMLCGKDRDMDVEEIKRREKYLGEDTGIFFSEDLFTFQQEFKNIFIESIGLNSEDTDLNIDSFVFDANLPPIQKIICFASTAKDKALKNNNIHEVKLIEENIQDLKNGLIDFYKEGLYIKAPYSSKKSYLDFLELDALIGDRTEVILGTKYVNWRNSKTAMVEKGVDTNLVIKGVEYANDPDTKFICLISSDTDFVPLIDYIKFKNKKVYLLSLNNIKNVTLKKAVGESNFFNLDHKLFEMAKFDGHYHEQVYAATSQRLMAEEFYVEEFYVEEEKGKK